jgi:hypothetical protein
MDSYLKLIQSTPVPVILIVAGIVFLLLSISGGISGKINVEPGRQAIAGVIGGILVLIGLWFNFGIVGKGHDRIAPGFADGTDKNSGQNGQPFYLFRKITEKDIAGKSSNELNLMRNTIYAWHGMRFSRKELQAYFNRQSWYKPEYDPGSFPVGILSQVEQENIQLLKYYEFNPR